jgi:DNA (cytosine-5)-methyltransferase 1
MSRPRLLDLFCGDGGATKGYQNAGFYVVGVDIRPMPRYCGDEFYQADAIEFLEKHGREYDAIHASPVCKAFTSLQAIWKNDHPDYITPIRPMLKDTGKPFVIENVKGAPLVNAFMLCGTMFGLRLFRHRLFETNFFVMTPAHIPHSKQGLFAGRTSRAPEHDNQVYSVYGHFSDVRGAGVAMGCEWMGQAGMSQAIPPAYTEFVGAHLMQVVSHV